MALDAQIAVLAELNEARKGIFSYRALSAIVAKIRSLRPASCHLPLRVKEIDETVARIDELWARICYLDERDAISVLLRVGPRRDVTMTELLREPPGLFGSYDLSALGCAMLAYRVSPEYWRPAVSEELVRGGDSRDPLVLLAYLGAVNLEPNAERELLQGLVEPVARLEAAHLSGTLDNDRIADLVAENRSLLEGIPGSAWFQPSRRITGLVCPVLSQRVAAVAGWRPQ
ncbi:MAG: hypothetical protein ACJ790_12050 [Myxococcaceae bacterium]